MSASVPSVAAAVAALPLVLGAAAPTPAASGEDGSLPGAGIGLSPRSGGAGTVVRVTAGCTVDPAGGTASSPAFLGSVPLRTLREGTAEARATVRAGLPPGSYPVTVNCSPEQSLTSSFGYTDAVRAVAVREPRTAPLRGEERDARQERRSVRGVDAGGAALALGGLLAAAALTGYLLTVRRRRAAHATKER